MRQVQPIAKRWRLLPHNWLGVWRSAAPMTYANAGPGGDLLLLLLLLLVLTCPKSQQRMPGGRAVDGRVVCDGGLMASQAHGMAVGRVKPNVCTAYRVVCGAWRTHARELGGKISAWVGSG